MMTKYPFEEGKGPDGWMYYISEWAIANGYD